MKAVEGFERCTLYTYFKSAAQVAQLQILQQQVDPVPTTIWVSHTYQPYLHNPNSRLVFGHPNLTELISGVN